MAKKKRARITVLEAVDNLSHLAELNEGPKETEWLDPAKVQENQDAIRETFVTLTHYLQHLYQKEREELKNPQTQKGIQAMMQLAGEAVDKVGRFTKLFRGAHAREEAIPEFKQLQHFYLSKVFSKVKQEKSEEAWEREGSLTEERQALKDLESVQKDHEYELFYISKEDGTPFFSNNLLRHIRMVGNFDEGMRTQDREDLFRKMEVILDRDLHVSAQEILEEGSNLLETFWRESLHYKDQEGPAALNKAVMALMLASNPKNLLHNTQGKSSIDYFIDFETYLRAGLDSDDYRKWRSTPTESLKPFKAICLKLFHFLCNALFLRSGARHAVITFIRELIEKRAKELPTIWGSLASVENSIRLELRNQPNGPLMKILKIFRHEEEKSGFDPLMQNNPPSTIFTLSSESSHCSIIHLPCPVHQDFIDRVAIVPEFKGYLRSLGSQKHLLFNLQDRTSWKEHARSLAIEELSKSGEFTEMLKVATLAKNTDFYHQSSDYLDLDSAKEFCKLCIDQIIEASSYGFYFETGSWTRASVAEIVDLIHKQFFDARPKLTRKERLDFIEIFYLFLVIKIVDHEKPDVISFSCKDGIDSGAAQTAAFYGFTRMLSTSASWSEEDKNFFLFAFFGPALLVRNRSILPPIFQRTLSALDYLDSVFQVKRDKILKACASLFPELPLTQIKIAS